MRGSRSSARHVGRAWRAVLAIALLAISAGFAGSAKAAAAAVPGPGDVLFSDDFSSGTPAKWTITQNASNWSVVNGQLRFNVAQCNVVSDAVAGETWWRDYAVDYDVTDIGVDDHVGVRAGSGAEAAILLLRRPNWIPARVRLYYDAIGPHDYTFDSLTSGVKNHVRVEVLGQTITTFVDGQKVFQ